MPAINFQSRFAADVESGRKYTTIRKRGRAAPGQTLYLFTGQRTKRCRRIGEALCLGVTSFFINTSGTCWLGGFILLADELESLARLDTAGQMGASEFVEFFRAAYGLPFDGELIIWSGRN